MNLFAPIKSLRTLIHPLRVQAQLLLLCARRRHHHDRGRNGHLPHRQDRGPVQGVPADPGRVHHQPGGPDADADQGPSAAGGQGVRRGPADLRGHELRRHGPVPLDWTLPVPADHTEDPPVLQQGGTQEDRQDRVRGRSLRPVPHRAPGLPGEGEGARDLPHRRSTHGPSS